MKNAISISEILGTIDDGSVEICATADATYDPEQERVSVALDAFARRVSVPGDGQHLPEAWLPNGERVTENLAREDAASFAKEVFQSWIRKVHASVPSEMRLHT